MSDTAIVVIGHGSRRESSNKEFEGFVSEFAKRHTQNHIVFAYLELAEPNLKEVLRSLCASHSKIVLLPLLLFAAGHVKKDLPAIVTEISAEFPEGKIILSEPLGVDERLASVIARDIPEGAQVLLVGRGTKDPKARADFFELLGLFAQAHGDVEVKSAFMAMAQPTVSEALAGIATDSPSKLFVIPYLLFGGVLVEKLTEEVEAFSKNHPAIDCQMGSCLGQHEVVFEVLADRLKQGLL